MKLDRLKKGQSILIDDEFLITVSRVRRTRALLTLSQRTGSKDANQFMVLSHHWLSHGEQLPVAESSGVTVISTRTGYYTRSGSCHAVNLGVSARQYRLFPHPITDPPGTRPTFLGRTTADVT